MRLCRATVVARRSALFVLLFAPASVRAEVTLKQCFEWAQASSESLQQRQEDITQSKARARATLGGVYPRLGWEFSQTWQDPKGVDTLQSRGFSGFVQKSQTESRFTLSQPIFSGLKEFSAWKGLGRESERDTLRLKRAAAELYELTAASFYATLADENERANTQTALQLAQDRVKELSGFFRLGKARESEVFAAKARAAGLRGTMEQVQARIRASREELSRLAHRDLSALTLKDEVEFPPQPGAVEESLAKVGDRSDVRAQKEDVEGRKWRVRYERGSYWPGVDLSGNYYTRRATFLEEIKWDVRLGVRVPIYAGGTTAANVRGAQSALRQSSAMLAELEQRVGSEVRTLHRDVLGAVEEAKALDDAAQAAKSGYDAITKEYKLGLATNLEVLSALDALQLQTSARDAAHYKAKSLYLRLLVALERVP